MHLITDGKLHSFIGLVPCDPTFGLVLEWIIWILNFEVMASSSEVKTFNFLGKDISV